MEDCVFCKIVERKIPCSKIYEDDDVIAFLDIMPASKGHSLVVTKKHYANLLDVPHLELCSAIKAVQKIGAAAMKATGAEGFNVLQSNGKAAGQVISHVHFHIIPRKEGDGLNFSWKQKGAKKEDLEKHLNDIRKHF